jgi:hypothetical protein
METMLSAYVEAMDKYLLIDPTRMTILLTLSTSSVDFLCRLRVSLASMSLI